MARRGGEPAVDSAGRRPARRAGAPARSAERLAAELARRNAELAAINSIQQGMAGSLDFKGIVELVGDRLRTVFNAENMSITWRDQESGLAHMLYVVQHGQRINSPAPLRPDPDGRFLRTLMANQPILLNSREELDAWGMRPPPGLEPSLATLTVPIAANDKLVGGITLDSHDPARKFGDADLQLLQTVAATMGLALENARLFNETKEALEQQTSTSELLKVIGRSVFDLEPVFDTLIENAVRLCGAKRGFISRFDGEVLRFAVGYNVSPTLQAFFEQHPFPPGRNSNAGRAALERRTIHNPDVLADPEYTYGGLEVDPYRTVLAIPMVKGDELLGVIVIYRHEVRPFTDRQIALVETFADQAVIAITNARLFNETQQALERQTATAEILKVIAGSPSDVQPVFDAIAASAKRLLGGYSTTVFRIVDGVLHLVAFTETSAEADAALAAMFPRPIAEFPPFAMVRDGGVARIHDTERGPDVPAMLRDVARLRGFRAMLITPLLRDDQVVGMISVTRQTPGPWAEHHAGLLRTFADQAVIAIENARLFNETKEALERQTATSEVLRVISGSMTDTQPVFDIIAERAARLTGAHYGMVFRYDGALIHVTSTFGINPQGVEAAERLFPMPPGERSVTAMAVRDGRTAMVPDVFELSETSYATQEVARSTGYRSVLSVPMVHGDAIIGAITVMRPERGDFPARLVELLQTFGTQAVIAIQNARLFNETKEALEQKTATAEILQVISSSRSDLQPVFDTIAHRAGQLCDGLFANVFRFDGELVHLVASSNSRPAG